MYMHLTYIILRVCVCTLCIIKKCFKKRLADAYIYGYKNNNICKNNRR